MRSTFAIAVLIFSVLLPACEDPAANKVRALTSNSNEPASSERSPSPLPIIGEPLPVTPEHSKVLFIGSKVTGRHEGGFNRFNGLIDLVGERPEQSSVTIEIETASVFTDADGLTRHLQTGDFFDVEKFPKASFKSTRIVLDTEKGAGNYIVTGDLEIRGVRKSVTFPAVITVTPEAVAVNSEFAINRKDFGILYPGKADDLIRDDVVIRLDLNPPRRR